MGPSTQLDFLYQQCSEEESDIAKLMFAGVQGDTMYEIWVPFSAERRSKSMIRADVGIYHMVELDCI